MEYESEREAREAIQGIRPLPRQGTYTGWTWACELVRSLFARERMNELKEMSDFWETHQHPRREEFLEEARQALITHKEQYKQLLIDALNAAFETVDDERLRNIRDEIEGLDFSEGNYDLLDSYIGPLREIFNSHW